MARSRSSTEGRLPPLRPEDGIALLRTQIEKARSLLDAPPISAGDLLSWELVTRRFVERACGDNAPGIDSLGPPVPQASPVVETNEGWGASQRARLLQTHIHRLEALIELLATEADWIGRGTLRTGAPASNRVFLVHGHALGLLGEVARYLENLRLDVVVLREQPNAGRALIEKFEDYADTEFAVVLLNGDDKGGLAAHGPERQRLRPRQNVVFELGYFIGRLGRHRVCCLHDPEVELPSDYAGVAFVSLADGATWRLELAKELKAVGFTIDMNLAL